MVLVTIFFLKSTAKLKIASASTYTYVICFFPGIDLRPFYVFRYSITSVSAGRSHSAVIDGMFKGNDGLTTAVLVLQRRMTKVSYQKEHSYGVIFLTFFKRFNGIYVQETISIDRSMLFLYRSIRSPYYSRVKQVRTAGTGGLQTPGGALCGQRRNGW